MSKPTDSVVKLPVKEPERGPCPKVTWERDENGDRVSSEPIAKTFGVESDELAAKFLKDLILTSARAEQADEQRLNDNLAVVHSIAPQDAIEAMLAVQMVQIHNATLSQARSLRIADYPQYAEMHEKALNKLARTFTSQMEALRKYRNGGEQTVRVEHVTVNEGGQAIVGNVNTGGSEKKRKATP